MNEEEGRSDSRYEVIVRGGCRENKEKMRSDLR